MARAAIMRTSSSVDGAFLNAARADRATLRFGQEYES